MPFLVVPEVSSERRDYIPLAWLEPPVIPSNKIRILPDATLWQFGLLTSAMHMAWVSKYWRTVREPLFNTESGVIYNTFPLPPVSTPTLEQGLDQHADAVLTARANNPNAIVGQTCTTPTSCLPTFAKAHQALDRAVDKLYRRNGFTSERERVEHLLGLYEKMVAPLAAKAKPKRRRRT